MARKGKKNVQKKKKNGNGGAPAPPSTKRRAELRQGGKKSGTSVPRGPRLGHHVATCSILDPFCVHARGAQRPDLGAPMTVSIPLKSLISLTALGTNGASRFTFIPSMAYSFLGHTGVGGPPITSWTSAAAYTAANYNNTLVASYAKEIRITSFGIAFRSIMTANTAKGMCVVTVENQPVLSQAGIPIAAVVGETAIFSLAANTEFCWVSKPLGQQAHLFRPYSVYSSTQSDFDWSSVTVEFSGTDTTGDIPLMVAEIFMNVEFTLSSAGGTSLTGMAQIAKAGPPPNPVAVQAAARAQASTPAIYDAAAAKTSEFLGRAAAKAIEDVGMWALTLI